MSELIRHQLSRRSLLRFAGVAAAMPLAAGLLAACGDDDDDDDDDSSGATGGSTQPAGATTTGGSETPAASGGETPGSDAGAGEPQPGGELVIGLHEEPPTLDPHASPSASTFMITSSVTESLLHLNSERELEPSLAESWEASPDGTTFTFNLRQDVTYHDGEPFNAQSVADNFDRIVNPDFTAGGSLAALAGYTGTDVSDEFTAVVNFEKSYAPFLVYAAGGTLGMVSMKAVEELGDNFGTQIVATGPFKVDSYTSKDNTVLVRWADYNRESPGTTHEGPAYLDKITIKFVPEAGTQRYMPCYWFRFLRIAASRPGART